MTNNFKKVMIFGRPGSGKSTFAYNIKDILNLPLYHLDKYFYQENWQERNYQEFLKVQQNIINQDKWIIDGNSTKSLEMRYVKADLALYFNFPKYLCYYRILKRYFFPNIKFDDRAIGCKETIRLSLIKYIWSFETRIEKQLTDLKVKYPNTQFREISNENDLKELLNIWRS